jgi:hypothetical protein
LTFYTGAADLQPIGSLGLLAMTAQRESVMRLPRHIKNCRGESTKL